MHDNPTAFVVGFFINKPVPLLTGGHRLVFTISMLDKEVPEGWFSNMFLVAFEGRQIVITQTEIIEINLHYKSTKIPRHCLVYRGSMLINCAY